MGDNSIQLFDSKRIRTQWDAEKEKWYFSVVDIVEVLTGSSDASAYWRKLKQRLKEEGNETVTNCHALKMRASDGKNRLTDVADQEQMFRLIQSIPSQKAEPIKRWIAQVASLSKKNNPTGFAENRTVAKAGGKVAKQTRDNMEAQLGRNM